MTLRRCGETTCERRAWVYLNTGAARPPRFYLSCLGPVLERNLICEPNDRLNTVMSEIHSQYQRLLVVLSNGLILAATQFIILNILNADISNRLALVTSCNYILFLLSYTYLHQLCSSHPCI